MLGVGNIFPSFDLPSCDEDNNLGTTKFNDESCKDHWYVFYFYPKDFIKNIRHPLVADTGLILSEKLGIVDWNEGVCRRATFIVDPTHTIQHASENALDTGRNVDDVFRTLKALQSGGLTACSWQPGDDFVG